MRLRPLRSPGVVRRFVLGSGLRVALALSVLLATAAFAETPLAVSVPAGDLSEALESLARQYVEIVRRFRSAQ